MPNDELIAALERAADTADVHAAGHRSLRDYFASDRCKTDAATIRAHIADLRAGNLVRRADVVAFTRRKAQPHHRIAHDVGGDDELRITHVARVAAVRAMIDAIAAGAHEGGGDE